MTTMTATTITANLAGPFTPLSDRIRRMSEVSRKRGASHDNFTLRRGNWEKAFFDIHAGKPYWERWARSMAYALENEPVRLFDDEELVGMLYQMAGPPKGYQPQERPEIWKDAEVCPGRYAGAQAVRRIKQKVVPYVADPGCTGHIGWRFDPILELGIEGHMEVIREHLAKAKDAKAKRLYRGALILWQAALRWNDKHVEAMKAALEMVPACDRPRLLRMIEICSQVPRRPARNFHEALQSWNMQHLAVMFENPYGGNGPGRLDYFLWPYLQRDLKEGRITQAQAKELIDEMFVRFQERLEYGDGWVEAIVPGGVHPDGRCSVNPLSYMMIHTIGALKQTHPVVYPRLCRNCPEDFIDLNVQYLLHGENRAQIYNDDACIEAIVRSGTSREDAAMYMAGGCMEISVQGKNSDLNFSLTHNVAKTLELVLNGGLDILTGERRIKHRRDLTQYKDFEDLYAAFETELEYEYKERVLALDIHGACLARYRPSSMISSLIGDCLERGRDQHDGGATYNEYGFAPLAVTSTADSLTAIKIAVYDQKIVTAEKLLAALRANFENDEPLRLRLRALPKFGQEDADADGMTNRVLQSVCRLAVKPRARFGGQLKPMIFNFVWTPWASRQLGARAEGCRAGDSIGHGVTPQSYAMTKGITAAINSSTSLDLSCVSGGATSMWDVDVQWVTFDRMKTILKTFLARGGMIFQGNTTSVRQLEEAMVSPDEFPNLIVRVGGFSARFATLDRELQTEIINRYRHSG